MSKVELITSGVQTINSMPCHATKPSDKVTVFYDQNILLVEILKLSFHKSWDATLLLFKHILGILYYYYRTWLCITVKSNKHTTHTHWKWVTAFVNHSDPISDICGTWCWNCGHIFTHLPCGSVAVDSSRMLPPTL